MTWKRPWYFYVQSLGVFLELLGRSLVGKRFGYRYYRPWVVVRHYWAEVRQGRTVRFKIDAYLDPEQMLDQPLAALRECYGIGNAGAWD